MTQPPPARPLYLDTTPDPVLAFFHAAVGEAASTAVLICSPWGWDDVASYRARRTWAEMLAASGHPTLRFDFPGSGDSGGSAYDEGRMQASVDAAAGAAAWLRRETRCTRVAAIGLGLGGLFAAQAIADGAAIDDLVLWGTSDRGRSFVRQERAFSQLQASRYSLTGEPEPAVLPAGWLEAGGFVLSANTIAALSEIDLARIGTGRLGRVLLLDRDGIRIDPRVSDNFRAAGVEVASGDGAGWTAMCVHPEQYEVPIGVIARVNEWLMAGPSLATEGVADRPATLDAIDISVGGARVRETVMLLDVPAGRRFAVLAEPIGGPPTDISAILLNAGAVRRIGPNRLWVETARRWAGRGVPTLRVDLAGIGDSQGDGTLYRDVGRFYVPELEDEIVAFIDELCRRQPGRRIVLSGLCAGGFWSFRGAARDERVSAALLINAGLLEWDPEVTSRRNARSLTRLRDPGWRRKVLRGEIRWSRMVDIGRAVGTRAWLRVRRLPSRLLPSRGQAATTTHVEELLSRLTTRGTRVLMAFSGDEPLHAELRADGLLAKLGRWPNVEVRALPGRDHTLRPIVVQQAVHELLNRELSRALDEVPATYRDPQP